MNFSNLNELQKAQNVFYKTKRPKFKYGEFNFLQCKKLRNLRFNLFYPDECTLLVNDKYCMFNEKKKQAEKIQDLIDFCRDYAENRMESIILDATDENDCVGQMEVAIQNFAQVTITNHKNYSKFVH